MPTIISHPAILLALRPAFRLSSEVLVVGAICSMIPDVDVVGFPLGIHYGDLLGHRGFTHSLFFAVALGAVGTVLLGRASGNHGVNRLRIFSFLFVCIASHGFLDAFTNGGLGVAFFSPFSNARYFFPWRPLEVSPIGIGDFLSDHMLRVLRSEFLFVWLPCTAIFVASRIFLMLRSRKRRAL